MIVCIRTVTATDRGLPWDRAASAGSGNWGVVHSSHGLRAAEIRTDIGRRDVDNDETARLCTAKAAALNGGSFIRR